LQFIAARDAGIEVAAGEVDVGEVGGRYRGHGVRDDAALMKSAVPQSMQFIYPGQRLLVDLATPE
jgi:hypothetical protein